MAIMNTNIAAMPLAPTHSPQATQKIKRKNGNKRKRKRKNQSNPIAPSFLRKTHAMIDGCDPSIAEWSDNGETFVVKDTAKFASEIIPDFFNHNKFSSFVRQLNFYGFRKIKFDPLRLKDAEGREESKYCKFKHDLFRQGRPNLLFQIRKSNYNESADKEEVESLKKEVNDLRHQLNHMSKDMAKLTSVIQYLVQSPDNPDHMSPVLKKRKKMAERSPSPVSSTALVHPLTATHANDLTPLPVTSTEPLESNFCNYDTNEMDPVISHVPSDIDRYDPIDRIDSVGLSSFTAQDEEMLNSLLEATPLDDATEVSL